MSKKDEAKREVLANKYPQMDQNFSELKRQASLNETQGLVQAQGQQAPPPQEEQGQKS